MVKLYLLVNGKLVLVDYGVLHKKHSYERQSYHVRVSKPLSYEKITHPSKVYHKPKVRRRSLVRCVKDFFTPNPW
jgi:hypothetical protein